MKPVEGGISSINVLSPDQVLNTAGALLPPLGLPSNLVHTTNKTKMGGKRQDSKIPTLIHVQYGSVSRARDWPNMRKRNEQRG